MSLVAGINKSKQISKWCEYKDHEGNVLAEFKIRGAGYKSYVVAIERAHNQISSKGFNVDTATSEDKLLHELLFDAVAVHLIEDWKGVSFSEEINGEIVEKEAVFTTENAKKLLNMGDIGSIIWLFVKQESEKMQAESDRERLEILGKSANSTNIQNMEATKKSRQPRKSKTPSTSI